MKKSVGTKVFVFRVWSVVMTTLAARVWFGDWHTTWFGMFLIPYCTFLHFIFEKVWSRYE